MNEKMTVPVALFRQATEALALAALRLPMPAHAAHVASICDDMRDVLTAHRAARAAAESDSI